MSPKVKMSTHRSERQSRTTAAIAFSLLATLALAAPVLARSGGNSAASAACEDGGYVNWTDAAGNPFRNAGACVSYAARGGTLAPVVVSPFSVSYRASGVGAFVVTVTGEGLEPGTGADVVLAWGDVGSTFGDIVDESGAATLTVGGVCTSGGVPLSAVEALGTPAGGAHTTFPLPMPDASICPLPA